MGSFLIILFAASLQAFANMHTVSGLAQNTVLQFDVKRICISDPLAPQLTMTLGLPPKVEVGVFKATLDPETNEVAVRMESLPGMRSVPFVKRASEVKEEFYASTDYTFKDFKISVPLTAVEDASAQISFPKLEGRLDLLVKTVLGESPARELYVMGVYLKVGRLRSLVAFRGQYSHVLTDLWSIENGEYLYEKLWPRIATLLGSSRQMLTYASHPNVPPKQFECNGESFLQYSLDLGGILEYASLNGK